MKKPIRLALLTSSLLLLGACNVSQETEVAPVGEAALTQSEAETASQANANLGTEEPGEAAPAQQAEPEIEHMELHVATPALTVLPELREAHNIVRLPPPTLPSPAEVVTDDAETPVAVEACDRTLDTGACELDRDTITFQQTRGRPSGVPQRLIIESIDFTDDTIIVRNVTDEAIVFNVRAGRRPSPWRVAAGNQGARTGLPDGCNVAAGARVRIHLSASGENDCTNIYLGWNHAAADLGPALPDGFEVAVLSPYG